MHSRRLFALLALGAALPAAAQTTASGSAQPQTAAQPAQTPVVTPVPVPPPPSLRADWSRKDADELLGFIDRAAEEGLDPADYDSAALRQAIDGKGDALDSVASATFLKLAGDLALGHVRGDARVDWHVKDDAFTVYDQQALLDRATDRHNIADSLRALLPTHPQYAGLKRMLAEAKDPALRDKIRINLDRWRWLPRDLGQKYVIVNVPSYRVTLVESGQVLSRRRAVAGALKTPTPQLSATITGAIFNPWWEVPTSISKEVAGKKGYVSVKTPDGGLRWRQPPGPTNALGRVKLVMGNPYAIYLHDTNAKNLFNAHARAFSHGCIRTEDAVGFAAALLEGTEWSRAKINQTVASGKSVQANVSTPIPVYIVYFTVASTDEGPPATYADMYGRDKSVLVAMNGRGAALASN
jgi:murein L,D-transpeptidase YcbB/YkuD